MANSYQLNCPVCSEILLPSDVLSSTPCGHIFHLKPCLTTWLTSNTTCPQCRSECTLHNSHRIYLPEVNFQDQEQLLERMNDINRQKQECEHKLKKIEEEKKSLEKDLRKKKKDFHKVLRRSKKNQHKNGFINNIPRSERNKSLLIVTVGEQTSQRGVVVKEQQNSQQPKKKRNSSRLSRSKNYFLRKRTEHRNNNNINTSNSSADGQDHIELDVLSDSD